MRALAWLLSLSLLVIAGAAAQQMPGLSGKSADEIKALQQRLAADSCYAGSIDGQASGALQDAIKACPLQDPILRIETGMHTGAIRGLAANRDCSLLATASEDKTVRLWSVPDGRLLTTVNSMRSPSHRMAGPSRLGGRTPAAVFGMSQPSIYSTCAPAR
jgi:WD40 repeat protein